MRLKNKDLNCSQEDDMQTEIKTRGIAELGSRVGVSERSEGKRLAPEKLDLWISEPRHLGQRWSARKRVHLRIYFVFILYMS